ncbi:unnamed protein product [Phytophthora fragariaefolia]|uniref:Unnamed protein product n=1 Tax=Phytophthora fragariaefolia TaxID=1490495 RepID=A0A9W7CH85_9STRA|nr:unnamed protein product [Phytophthora fragariaefolia]
MPAAFCTFVEELGALQLTIPAPSATSASSEASAPTTPASSGTLGGATATSGSSTSLTVDSDTSDDSGPLQWESTERPTTALGNLCPGIAVSADSEVLSFAPIPSGSIPPFVPIPQAPSSTASSTASTASLPSTPTAPSGIAPVTEASVPVEIDDDGGSEADGAPSDASDAPGGILLTPLPDLANPLLEPAFRAPGAQGAWCEILNARIPKPIASDRVTECSVAGIQEFADWEGPAHPWQRLRARLPEPPCRRLYARQADFDSVLGTRHYGEAVASVHWRTVGRTEHSHLGFALWERAHWISVAAVEQWLQNFSDRIGSDTPEYLETEAAWWAYNKARNLRADRLRLQIPKWFWVWCTPDAGGKIKCPPEILLEPSMMQYSFETLIWAPSTAVRTVEAVDLDARQPWRNCWVGMPAEHPFNTTFAPCNPSVPLFVPEGTTREEVGAAIVVNPALRQSHVTAPWVQEFTDARAQAAAESSAAADSPSDTSSARTPIPAADQADVQAELGDNAPARTGLNVLADLASTAEI